MIISYKSDGLNFSEWLKSETGKKIIILIHPEIVCELGTKKTQEYNQKLIQHTPNFDYVITHHWGPSENWLDQSKDLSDNMKNDYKLIYKTTTDVSQESMYDYKNFYGCSYEKELPDYLIENPKSTVYFAGGYAKNCVKIAYNLLFNRIGWLLKETNTKIEHYEILLINPDQEPYGENLIYKINDYN